MTQHQDAAHRVARFLEGYATLRGPDPERITAVRVDDTGDRNLLVSDLKILCYTAFNTPSTPESLAQDAAASQLVTDQYAKAAADNYETMLDTDRPLSSRRQDFERIASRAPEIHRSCPGSPTGRHEYDDDGALYPDWASNYPGSKPGDPCIHCDHEKLEEESAP